MAYITHTSAGADNTPKLLKVEVEALNHELYIFNEMAGESTPSSAITVWTTNKSARGGISYRKEGVGEWTAIEDLTTRYTKEHHYTIQGLSSNTMYYIKVTAEIDSPYEYAEAETWIVIGDTLVVTTTNRLVLLVSSKLSDLKITVSKTVSGITTANSNSPSITLDNISLTSSQVVSGNQMDIPTVYETKITTTATQL